MSETNTPLVHACHLNLSTGGACLICGRQVMDYGPPYQTGAVVPSPCPSCAALRKERDEQDAEHARKVRNLRLNLKGATERAEAAEADVIRLQAQLAAIQRGSAASWPPPPAPGGTPSLAPPTDVIDVTQLDISEPLPGSPAPSPAEEPPK